MVLLRPFKETLGLQGLRQKDVEAFLHIDRDDIYTGGELIEVYKQYLGRSRYDRLTSGTPLSFAPGSGLPIMPRSQSEALLSLLLLHNAEDVEGLIRLSCLMPLINLLSGAKVPGRAALSFEDDALFVSFPGITELPCEIKCDTLFAGPENITLQLPYYTGTLKHFFPDHKNYYYLPATDSVIHKSAGMGLPKEARQNAKPGNCYVKKAGTFLPFCPEGCMEFKTDLKDKTVYSEVSDVKKQAENDILKAVFPNRSQNGI